MPTVSKVLCTFPSSPRNNGIFQETSDQEGCDSLPLVVAFTSKQCESLLSYALHFLHTISHQNVLRWRKSSSSVCEGEGKKKKRSPPPWKSARKAFSEDCGGRRSRAATRLLSVSPTPKRSWKEKKNKVSKQAESAFITGARAQGSLICCLFKEQAGPRAYLLPLKWGPEPEQISDSKKKKITWQYKKMRNKSCTGQSNTLCVIIMNGFPLQQLFGSGWFLAFSLILLKRDLLILKTTLEEQSGQNVAFICRHKQAQQ